MSISLLLQRCDRWQDAIAVCDGQKRYTYSELVQEVTAQRKRIAESYSDTDCAPSQTIAIQDDYSFASIAAFIAVLAEGKVAVLLSPQIPDVSDLLLAAKSAWHWQPKTNANLRKTPVQPNDVHVLLEQLLAEEQPGFVVFSSGSEGTPKAVLHDFSRFTTHLRTVAKAKITLGFLLLDHIAGIDTLLYTLFAGGTLVVPQSRSVADVTQAIERHHVEVLPASPSFLKLLTLNGNSAGRDLSTLEIVTYGSEPVAASTIAAVQQLLPSVKLVQKYGTSEFGSPRSQTKKQDGLWLKLDSEHLTTKVQDGMLWVKASSMMRGYLNAEQPRTEDGWTCTGDSVEVDGPWFRILGRASELINVGGEKVYPSEVEAVIEELEQVDTAVVAGEPHNLLGQIVTARVNLSTPLDQAKKLIRQHCRQRLQSYKVPMKVTVVEAPLRNARQKKIRDSKC